jgi:hypothetical protein
MIVSVNGVVSPEISKKIKEAKDEAIRFSRNEGIYKPGSPNVPEEITADLLMVTRIRQIGFTINECTCN